MANFFNKIKEKVTNFFKRNTTSSLVALSIGGFFLIRFIKTRVPIIKLSYFVLALKNNVVEEVVVKGNTLFFRGVKSAKWFQTNVSMISSDKLYSLLLNNSAIEVSCVDNDIKETFALATSK